MINVLNAMNGSLVGKLSVCPDFEVTVSIASIKAWLSVEVGSFFD